MHPKPKYGLVLLFFMLLFEEVSLSYAQGGDTKEDCFSAWKDQSKLQSRLISIFNDSLYRQLDARSFTLLSKQIMSDERYSKDRRLEVRSILFDLEGKEKFKIALVDRDSLKINRALFLADALADEHVVADVYSRAADANYMNAFMLYAIKSLEIQEKIGVSYFSNTFRQAFIISSNLYIAADYDNALRYGETTLNFVPDPLNLIYEQHLVLQLDVVGATYLALQNYEQALLRYKEILSVLEKSEFLSADMIALWHSIAVGRIGSINRLSGQYEEAIPKFKKQYEVGKKYRQFNNMAIASNEMGLLKMAVNQTNEAKQYFQSALSYAELAEHDEEYAIRKTSQMLKRDVYKGLADVYLDLKQADSCYYYLTKHLKINNDIIESNMLNKLHVLKTDQAFADAMTKLVQSKAEAEQQRKIRNYSIGVSAIICVLLVLLYRQKFKKEQIQNSYNQLKKEQVEAEVVNAKKTIARFKQELQQSQKKLNEYQQATDITDVIGEIKSHALITDERWESFRYDFIKVYPLFFEQLGSILDKVTPQTEKICALLYLQFTSQEIAQALGISEESVSRSKRRIRERVQGGSNQRLEDIILNL